MKGKFLTDCGQLRNHNEDSGGVYSNQSGQLLAIIADGMGGHQAGDVASEMVSAIMKEKWQEMKEIETPGETEEWLAQAVADMNSRVYQHSIKNEAYKGMGTTIVIAVCTGEFLTVAHIGDSRCYLSNELGFKQITDDHSLVNELVRSGQISKDDAEIHPRKNVLIKALGTEEYVEADIQSLMWENGDRILLCSDGLTNKLSDDEMAAYIQSDEIMDVVGQKMIQLANDRGGEDNISLVIVHHDLKDEEGETAC